MGHRFRKSIKVAPGVKVNLNKKSASVTLGGKGAHYTVNSKGKRTASVGIPGTGLSYSKSSGGARKTPSHTSKRTHASKRTIPQKTNGGRRGRKQNKWIWIIVALFVLGLFGSCLEDAPASTPETTLSTETESTIESSIAETLTETETETETEAETETVPEASTEAETQNEIETETEYKSEAYSEDAVNLESEASAESISPTPPAESVPVPTVSQPAPASETQNTVYWTPNGKSYHSTQGCSTLARSKTILSGSLDDALAAGKSDPCDRCH